MRVLCISWLLGFACMYFSAQAWAGSPSNSSPSLKTAKAAAIRKLVFPSQFSLGRLYVYKDKVSPHHYPNGKMVAETLGRFVGEAKGTVQFAVPDQAVVYLVASYQLTEHPEVLTKLDPNVVDCLSFANTGIMAEVIRAIKPVSHLTGLRYLDLSVSELTDESLTPLKALTNLERLNLYMSGINGTFLKEVTSLRKLLSLELTSNLLDAKAFVYLSKFQSLENLQLNRCGVRDGDMQQVSKLANLTSLGLSQDLMTGKGLALLKPLKKLRFLSLTNCNLSTSDLMALKGTDLSTLNLPANSYTPAEMSQLQRAMPHTKLFCRSGQVSDYEKTLYGPLH